MTPLVQDARIAQPVTIRGQIERTVQGFVYGLWAVTPDPGRANLHRVTHIPTGFSATMYRAYPLAVARTVARRYRDELDDNFWSSYSVAGEVPAAESTKVRRILAEADEEVAG